MNDSRVSILIVEDDSEALLELSTKLTPVRFRVATARFGPAVFEFVEERAPDFVFFDARFLYLEGVSLCEKIRERSAHTRVLFLDVEGKWSLFLEPLGSDDSDMQINPCGRKEVLQTIASIAESDVVPAAGAGIASMNEDADWRSTVE